MYIAKSNFLIVQHVQNYKINHKNIPDNDDLEHYITFISTSCVPHSFLGIALTEHIIIIYRKTFFPDCFQKILACISYTKVYYITQVLQ